VSEQRPFDSPYRNQLVRVADLTVVTDTVSNLRFENCQIVGPAVVAFMGCNIADCSFDVGPGTLESIVWEAKVDMIIIGAVGFMNCEFYGCSFQRIGVALPPAERDAFIAALSPSS